MFQYGSQNRIEDQNRRRGDHQPDNQRVPDSRPEEAQREGDILASQLLDLQRSDAQMLLV
jgi:hypothetical protein